MHFQLAIRLIVLFLMLPNLTFAKDKPVENVWFQNQNCTHLEIKKPKSISDHKLIKSITIEDEPTIAALMQRISKIPPDGDMMISFGPKAEKIELKFHCGDEIQTIEIYGKRFKTPSTGFNSGRSEIEERLYQDIDALLFPEFHKNILKVKGLAVPFKDFTITYKGTDFKDYSPASLSFNIDQFLITDQNKKSQHVQVRSGQQAPQAQVIEVNHKKLTLLTYETGNGVRLYPDYFQITD